MKKENIAVNKQFALPLDERTADTPGEDIYIEDTIVQITGQTVLNENIMLKDALQPTLSEEAIPTATSNVFFTNNNSSKNTVDNNVENKEEVEYMELVYSQQPANNITTAETLSDQQKKQVQNNLTNSPASAVSGGFLAKPSNIYAELRSADNTCSENTIPPVKQPVLQEPVKPSVQKEEEPSFDMQLVIKDEVSDSSKAADEPWAPQTQNHRVSYAEDPAPRDEAEEQKRRAAERIQKLRNLSFNVNAADTNNEFETVPAYIRRNLELYNTVSPAENFYSSYEVKADENNNGQISTINTFLDGKKPD